MDNQRKEHTVDELTAENNALRAEIERLQQQVDMLKKAVFGPKSERKVFHDVDSGEQLSLFNEAETEARREESEEVTVPAHKRKKKRSRAEILKDLPTDEVIHKVEDKTCDKCGSEMKTVGKEFVHDELVYVPEKMFICKHYVEVDEKRFRSRLRLFVLFRILQVLGAYGFRGYFERKKHFIDSIPPAMQNLRELLKEGEGGFGYSLSRQYPYLVEMLHRLTELPQFAQIEQPALNRADGYKTTDKNPYKAHPQDGPATYSKYDGKGPLVVRVFSFSYRKGIPEDESGNGGGYVFDCRSTHNPGRYEPYKKLTGLDEPVIRFLEDDGEILTFLESVYRLADAHVRRYIQRGFTSLMFSFGCTGGQHRSVYSAQHLAEHIHRKFGIEVHINHREQGITQVLKNI